MHSEIVSIWCRFLTGDVMGPYFFENEVGQENTVQERQKLKVDDITLYLP